jgi:S1-C subfamily serine protease
MGKRVFGLSLLLAGFLSGLVLSGRLSLSGLSDAAASPTAPAAEGAAAAPPQATGSAVAPAALPQNLPNLSDVAEAALRVSANIQSTITRRVRDPFWELFTGRNLVQRLPSLGSGVVVSSDGYILTNTHVIGNAGAEIRVTLHDGEERSGRVVGIDELSDIGVIKVEADGLPTIPWGDSSKLRVAEWVLAIGNPFQLSGTVTLGIVSTQVPRSGDQMGAVESFIQTDAAINPGNSGGALINQRGELVGINTMIYSETGGYQGIGFAIPSNRARQIMTELVENGAVRWGSIGMENIDAVLVTNPAVARRYQLPGTGVFVRALSTDSSVYRAGLRPGDVIRSINGQTITSSDQIERVVIRQRVGSTIELGVLKEDGREVTLRVPVVARESDAARRRG